MSEKFIWSRTKFAETGRGWMNEKEFKRPPKSKLQIIKDLDPYRNVINGATVGGRRQHREFLRENGCEEVGNERPKLERPQLPDVRPDVIRAFQELKAKG